MPPERSFLEGMDFRLGQVKSPSFLVVFPAFRKMLARLGKAAGLGFPANPHMLRHAGLTKLAQDGHDAITLADYAGHRQLQNLKRYIQLSPERFKAFRWGD